MTIRRSLVLCLPLFACAHPEPPDAAAAIDATLLRSMSDAIEGGAFPETSSVVIMRDDEIAFEAYFNNTTPQTLNNTRSATKTVVALAVGAAIEDGALASVDARVFDFFEDRAPFEHDAPLKRQITIRDLLTMSSALDCDDNNNTPGNEENMYPRADWKRFALDLPLAEGWARDGDGLGPWRYCTAGSFMLGQVVERATGERIDRYVERRLLKPMGIVRSKWFASPSGEIQTGGGLELEARDLAKIGYMLANDGVLFEKRILPSSWIKEMETVRRAAYGDMRYGYQIWTRDYASPCGPAPAWLMAGNGGNAVLALPGRRASIAVARTRYNTRGMHEETQELIERYILPALGCPGG